MVDLKIESIWLRYCVDSRIRTDIIRILKCVCDTPKGPLTVA